MPHRKLIGLLFAAMVLLAGCSEADTEVIKTTKTPGNEVSFEAFKQATGLMDFSTKIKIPRANTLAQRDSNLGDLEEFNIDVDFIKKSAVDQKVVYTFSIEPKVIREKEVFYNLVYYNVDGNWEYSVLELRPTASMYSHILSNDNVKYEGGIKELYTSNTSRGTGCVTIFVEFHHCTGTGPCASGVCDLCSLCVDFDSFRMCRIEAEQYATSTFVENPDYVGSGGDGLTIHNPGYIVSPNLGPGNIKAIRAERAAAFYAGLSAAQQAWAEAHPESYNVILEEYLNHYSPDNEVFAIEMIDSMLNNDGYSGDGFTGDADNDNPNYDGPRENIPSVITLSDNSQVTVTFGTTASDGVNANQPVAPELVEALKSALSEANSNLPASDKITSIYIAATTNGSHAPTSNHPKGTAMDISRLNGTPISTLGNNNQVKAVQNALDAAPHIRENFGPSFKHKTYSDGTINVNYPVAGHADHIHFSVQS